MSAATAVHAAEPAGAPGTGRNDGAHDAQRLTHVLRAEWVKFWTVRSTAWSLAALVAVGVGLTAVVCATSAEWLASESADESAASFVTWGMMLAQVAAVVLGALAITAEHTTGLVRATYAAVPRRGRVLLAKAIVLGGVLTVAGIATALGGYLAGNFFLDRAGVGVPLDGDGVLRALVGNGLYLTALGLLTFAVGLLVRHTAAALSIVLGTVFVLGNLAFALPGAWGEWIAKTLPGNAGIGLTTPVNFNPDALGPWTGFAVMLLWVAVVGAAGTLAALRRDA